MDPAKKHTLSFDALTQKATQREKERSRASSNSAYLPTNGSRSSPGRRSSSLLLMVLSRTALSYLRGMSWRALLFRMLKKRPRWQKTMKSSYLQNSLYPLR
jgi:hypothetical protein